MEKNIVYPDRGVDAVDGLEAVLLGKPAIFWQGKRVTFPFSKMEALLYYLFVKVNATRNEIASILWSDMDESSAKKNLRNTLYLLKKLIPGELLLMPSRSLISLNPAVIYPTDLQQFEQGRPNSLDLWRGEFLEGFFCKDAQLFDEWISVQREWLKSEYCTRLTKHIIDLINDKKYSDAKQYLTRLIEVDEYNESAYRALMKMYEHGEDTSKVIEIYHRLERKLKKELGITTHLKTKEIYERVMRRKTAETAIPVKEGAVFFGRDKELCWLTNRIEGFAAGNKAKQLIVLHGEQGVGKSAIVTQLLEILPPKGAILLQTQCYQAELTYPYKAWSSVFLQVMEALKKEHVALPALWRQVILYMFPTLAASEDLLLADLISNTQLLGPTMVDEVMCGLLGKLAGLQKIVLVVEDVHWMDSQGLCVLKNFLRGHLSQVICIATCRSEYLDRFDRRMGERGRNEWIEWLPVERFSQADVAQFSALVLSAGKSKPELQQKLYEYTKGNALFLVESFTLIQMGQDIGRLSSRLQSVLKERISDLSEKGRKILDIISAFFRDATYEELVAVCGLNEFELVEAIEELQQKKLVLEVSVSGRRGPIYTFCHALIRDFVYSQLSLSRQKLIHHQIGVHLEKLMSVDFRARGLYFAVRHHYSQAGEKIKVLEYTIKIAEKYSCPHYEIYPELSNYHLSGNEALCDQLQIIEHLEQVESLLASLQEESAGEDRLGRYKAAYLEMLGQYCIWRGEHRSGLKVLHRLLRLAAARDYLDYQIKGYQQVIYCGIQVRKPRMIERFANTLFRKANEANLQETMATALRFKGLASAMQHEKSMAEQYYRRSIAMFKRLDVGHGYYVIHIAAAYNYIGDLRRGDRNLPAALAYYEKAIMLYGKRNIGEGLSIVYINAGYTAFQLGDYAKSGEYLAAALNDGEQFGGQRGYWRQRSYCTLHCVQALIAVRENRLQEGRRFVEEADTFFVTYKDLYQKGIVLRTKTEIRLAMSKDEKVREVFCDYLTLSVQEYYSQSKAIFDKLGAGYEMDALDLSV